MLSRILLRTTPETHQIISIFVSIVPFLVAHAHSDSDDFLDQNTIYFLNIFSPFPFLLPHYPHLCSVALSLFVHFLFLFKSFLKVTGDSFIIHKLKYY